MFEGPGMVLKSREQVRLSDVSGIAGFREKAHVGEAKLPYDFPFFFEFLFETRGRQRRVQDKQA